MNYVIDIVGVGGETLQFDFETLMRFPALARVADVSALDEKRSGGAVYLSALVPDDERGGGLYATLESGDGKYAASVPLDDVLDRALIIFEQRGRPLSREQGGPFRFWVPDAAKCKTAAVDQCANIKNLRTITLSKEPGRNTRSCQ